MNGKRVKRLRRLLRENMAPGHPGFEGAFKAVKRAAARGLPQPQYRPWPPLKERRRRPSVPVRTLNAGKPVLHCQLIGRIPFSTDRRIWREGEPIHNLRPNLGRNRPAPKHASIGVPN